MKGYVARKGNRWYAVIYEGPDPVTGKERRRWHAAGPCRDDAERLAARLARELEGRDDEVRGLTLGAFLTSRWLPGKRLVLADTTFDGYRRNVDNHIVPALGRVGLRRLRPHHLEAFYERLLHPSDDRAPLAPKTVYEIHLVIRAALDEAVRRGLLTRNVALTSHAPRLRSIPKVEQGSWTAEELQAFLRVGLVGLLALPVPIVGNGEHVAFDGEVKTQALTPGGHSCQRPRLQITDSVSGVRPA
jgi:hypothetical protein